MSILIVGLADHRVQDSNDEAAVIKLLSLALPALSKVSDYLRSIFPTHKELNAKWLPIRDYTYFAYHGPGGFRVQLGNHVAVIGTGCRHSAFTTIEPLQAVYLSALRSIALAIGGNRLALLSDENDRIHYDAAIREGASLDKCLGLIEQNWGISHPKIETISDDKSKRRKSPIWYLETIHSPPY